MSVTLLQMTASLTASPAQPMSDASIDAETTRLAVQAKAGDSDAFCALIDLHERAARRVAAAALGNLAEADEAVQDACLTAWQRIAKLEEPAAFRAWLLRITWRKALDRRRSVVKLLRRFVSSTSTTRAPGVEQAPSLDSIAARDAGADEELLRQEREAIVGRTIQSLPSRLRDPFLLASSGEHRYEDIAVLLGIPVGTVKWRVSEARRVLREKLTRVGV